LNNGIFGLINKYLDKSEDGIKLKEILSKENLNDIFLFESLSNFFFSNDCFKNITSNVIFNLTDNEYDKSEIKTKLIPIDFKRRDDTTENLSEDYDDPVDLENSEKKKN